MSGLISYHAGLVAEGAVENHYVRSGHVIEQRRWRGSGGEIDLITRDGDSLVFIEVKKSKDFAAAAERLSNRQMQRIYAAASEFLAGEPNGQDTEVRFDVALVNSIGEIQVIENAFGHS